MDRGGLGEELPLYIDHRKWLTEMKERYQLPDEGKVLRVLVTYAMHEGDTEEIFNKIRCSYCG